MPWRAWVLPVERQGYSAVKKPRHYQTKLMNDARELVRELRPKIKGRKPRIVLRAACGAGKTFMSSMMAKSALDKGGTVAFLVHRDFLLSKQVRHSMQLESITHSWPQEGR
jgi:Type III restriction enzyme, res subunit.